jgi:hypothetical protein
MGKWRIKMSDIMKWIFSFVMMGLTVGWGIFSVNVVFSAFQLPIESVDVIAAAGVSGVMGSLLTFDALIVQYWFRKKPSNGETSTSEPK